jgi:hypothetical protein
MLQAVVDETPAEDVLTVFPPLTVEDTQLFGSFVQLINYVEFNLRQTVEVFAHANLLANGDNYLQLHASGLLPAVKAVVDQMDAAVEDRHRTNMFLDDLEEGRRIRHLIAHWAARRFPNHDAFLFFTKHNRDAIARTGRALELHGLATAIVNVGSLRHHRDHIAELERWFAEKQYEWHLRYNPPLNPNV